MVASSRRNYSFDDYLHVEEVSAVRHEFLDGQILALAGGTPEHAALSAAALVALGASLTGKTCRLYSGDLRIRVLATGLATYADASVLGGDPERDSESPSHVTNPTVIVEVLSKSTEDYDRGEKREHYQQIASLREYVLVAQHRRHIEVFARSAAGAWTVTVSGPGQTPELPSVGVSLSVGAIYDAAGVV